MRTGARARLRFLIDQIEWRALRLRPGRCPLCGRTWFIRLSRDLLGTRCLSCEASPISMAIGSVLKSRVPDYRSRRICEFSSRGPFFAFLRRDVPALTFSEFFDDVAPGGERGGVPCEDVQHLTYADESFDVCTSTEMFEHVPDDLQAFREVHRVLRPGGHCIFTVPLDESRDTIERARSQDGVIQHLEPPTHHDDFIRGRGQVLVFRDYGRDVVDRLRAAGFEQAEIVDPGDPSGLGCRALVVAARKAGSG